MFFLRCNVRIVKALKISNTYNKGLGAHYSVFQLITNSEFTKSGNIIFDK